jgi:hypothetical protein
MRRRYTVARSIIAVLRTQIAKQTKGSLGEREGWWTLCHDDQSREFFVEHEWHHMNAYKVDLKAETGTTRLPLEGYVGRGADKVQEAVAAMLAEARHT